MPKKVELPPVQDMVGELMDLVPREEAIRLCLEGQETGIFRHPDGRVDRLKNVRINRDQCGLLSYLARRCPTPQSIEVGFGMGSSAAIILGTRQAQGEPFTHLIFDPYGLPGGEGKVVQSYLENHFPDSFHRLVERSELGLGRLIAEGQEESTGFIFIDGAHQFENVMTDFVMADKLCCVGGYIAFDDAYYPAIETVLRYIARNRPDYAINHLPVHNCSVIQKIAKDERPWSWFKPFEVPKRHDWDPSNPTWRTQV